MVNHFRQILIWPLQLTPLPESSPYQDHWEFLRGDDCPWREVQDEFTLDPDAKVKWSEGTVRGPRRLKLRIGR